MSHHVFIRTLRATWALIAIGVLGLVQTARALPAYSYLPSPSTTDGRFLAIAGAGYSTITGDTIFVQFAVPDGTADLEFGIFDGETGNLWDQGTTQLTYKLYSDTTLTGAGTNLLNTWSGASMSDNAWFSVTMSNAASAQDENGNYYYTMKIFSSNPSQVSLSAFKLRCRGQVALIKDQAFNFMVPMSQPGEAAIIYPAGIGSLGTTTYNGTWDFYIDVPQPLQSFVAYDGDFDFGNYANTTRDADDGDTPNTIPSWATSTSAVAEGVAVGDLTGSVNRTGYPCDNSQFALFTRGSNVTYYLRDPNGDNYTNNNPSGNVEWEQFKVSRGAFNAGTMDANADTLPPGIYKVHVSDMDLGNQNSWRFSYNVLGVDSTGDPDDPDIFDVDPPTTTVTLNNATCWPPNHRMINLTANVTWSDNRPGPVTIELDTITCNQPINTTGDGNTSPDIQNASFGTSDMTFSLRCERRGDQGGNSSRVYTIVYKVTDGANNVTWATATFSVVHDQSRKEVVATGIEAATENIAISSNYPNPFNERTTVEYSVKNATDISVKIYNSTGEVVRTLDDGWREAGSYSAVWDGRDENGEAMPSGVYLFHVGGGDCGCGKTVEMVLMRGTK